MKTFFHLTSSKLHYISSIIMSIHSQISILPIWIMNRKKLNSPQYLMKTKHHPMTRNQKIQHRDTIRHQQLFHHLTSKSISLVINSHSSTISIRVDCLVTILIISLITGIIIIISMARTSISHRLKLLVINVERRAITPIDATREYSPFYERQWMEIWQKQNKFS